MCRLWHWFIPALVASMLASRAEAQPDPSLEPTRGSATLKAGFKPDPFKKDVTAGGTISTNIGGVRGNVGRRPEFRLDYAGGESPLTFAVEATDDTTLLIRLPDGKWIANADGCRGQVRLEKPTSGRYDIFVGSIGKENIAATLVISGQKLPPALGKGNLPDCFVLTVGVDHYEKHNANRLNGCLNDARLATASFKAQQGVTFRKVEYETLLDEAATLERIVQRFQDFAKRGTAGDYMVLFLSAHGALNKDDRIWLFLPYDFRELNPVASALHDDQILEAADVLVKQKKNVVIVVDSCHSGQLRQRAMPYLNHYKGRQEGGLALLVACSADQESAALGTCSAFSRAFVEALTPRGDANKNGKITMGEIKNYIIKRTPEILKEFGVKNKQDCSVDWSGSFSEDTTLASTRTIEYPPTKFKPPRLPRAYGNPSWDISELEKRFDILRCSLNEGAGVISFELDVKEDMIQTFECRLQYTDSEGVKFEKSPLTISDPRFARKGGRMVLNFIINRSSLPRASLLKIIVE